MRWHQYRIGVPNRCTLGARVNTSQVLRERGGAGQNDKLLLHVCMRIVSTQSIATHTHWSHHQISPHVHLAQDAPAPSSSPISIPAAGKPSPLTTHSVTLSSRDWPHRMANQAKTNKCRFGTRSGPTVCTSLETVRRDRETARIVVTESNTPMVGPQGPDWPSWPLARSCNDPKKSTGLL
jgi:hypothetical protein